MKTKLISLLGTVALLSGLVSCRADELSNYYSYRDGIDGKDGSSLLTGEGAPATTLGNDGDSYIDTTTWDYYTKASGTWTKTGNIKGDAGKDLTAKTYTVKFYDGNDEDSSNLIATETYEYGEVLKEPTLSSDYDNYIFDWTYKGYEWQFNVDDPTLSVAYRVYNDMSLNGTKYKKTNSYTLKTGHCSFTKGEQTNAIDLTYGAEYTLPSITSDDGYIFIGWYLDGEQIDESGDSWEYYKDEFTLTAYCVPTVGVYPQSKVTNTDLISTLTNTYGSNLPSNGNDNGWTSYDYYYGVKDGDSTKPSNENDYMWYKDITYDNQKYRAVYFTEYRPSFTDTIVTEIKATNTETKKEEVTGYKGTNQYSNGYYTNTIYWFEYEPIDWIVYSATKDNATLTTTKILDAQPFNSLENDKGSTIKVAPYDDPNNKADVYSTDYKYSEIRGWLNTTFYNTAFTSKEQSNINKTKLANGASSTFESYQFNDTADKVYLPNSMEASQLENKHSDEPQPTDYALCQGFLVDQNMSNYLTRSPWYPTENIIHIMYYKGYRPSTMGGGVNATRAGVRPFMNITISLD